ncbi:hypothetical protein T440DRAFT_483413 [Plenodomus tracheiphilus IPT5]|uniref:Uncharacterized protein n=1 Tax=Plenodomus tracheiphilus IPT5 TaxID=1408161 RepID=A0A6A7AQS1_9PLEO|nr:hypothetical protein T440DRAFT_483413 [Plenodomus tracheiphilus IPT5]
MISATALQTKRVLIEDSEGAPMQVNYIPASQPDSGTIIMKILSCQLHVEVSRILEEETGSTWPTSFIPGGWAIRPDTTSMEIDQLVLLEPWIRGRHNPGDVRELIMMAEIGVLKLGRQRTFEVKNLELEQYKQAFKWADENNELGQIAALVPWWVTRISCCDVPKTLN